MQQENHLNCHALSPIALENTQIMLELKCRREFSWTGHNLSPFAIANSQFIFFLFLPFQNVKFIPLPTDICVF
jgi:hypothetical protein